MQCLETKLTLYARHSFTFTHTYRKRTPCAHSHPRPKALRRQKVYDPHKDLLKVC